MAKETKERKIGKKTVEKQDPEWLAYYKKHKSWIQGVIFGVIVIFFLILNNTRTEPQSGNYPPGVDTSKVMDLLKADSTATDSTTTDTLILR
ncbi:MAG: hypothetical protein AMXMBFR49_30180 [Chlorobiota bacterium]